VAIVTRLRASERRADRIVLFLDGEPSITLPIDLAAALHIGQDLTADELATLGSEAEYRKGLGACFRFLSHRPRSRAEIERYIARRSPDPAVSDRLLQRLAELELVDDTRFARWWVENRCRHRPRGKRALRFELATNGIPEAVIATALASIDEDDLARQVAVRDARRFRSADVDTFRRRLYAHLLRRGFPTEVARSAVEAASDRQQADDDVAEERDRL
jgi:regulatory protein